MKKNLEKLLTRLSNFRRTRLINRYKQRDRILDLGCGTGSFIRQVSKKNWQRHGADPDYQFPNNKSGVKFYSKDLSSCGFSDRFFDVITMWHVIEHLANPEKLLKEVQRTLKNDGLLIISTPNLDSFGYKITGQNWFHFNAPEHRSLFNIASLKKNLDATGFLIIKVNYPLLEYPLDLFHSVMRTKIKSKELKILLLPFLLPFLLTVRFVLSLIKKGETIEVVCVKKT